MFSNWLHTFKSTVSFGYCFYRKLLWLFTRNSQNSWRKLSYSEVELIHLSFHIPWCNGLSVLDWDLTFMSLLILCAWSNDLTLHQSLTRQGFGSCAIRKSHQAAFAGVDLPWLSQTKGATQVKEASWISKDYPNLSTCVPAWWPLQRAVLFSKCCVEEWITSWL